MSDLEGLPAALGHFVCDYHGGTFVRFEVAGTRWECLIGVEEAGVMATARGATPAQALMQALLGYDQWQVEREPASGCGARSAT